MGVLLWLHIGYLYLQCDLDKSAGHIATESSDELQLVYVLLSLNSALVGLTSENPALTVDTYTFC